MGLAINFKVYLIAAVVPLLLKRRWRWVEGALISTVLVYAFSYALLGRGTPLEIYDNIVEFSSQPADQILNQWYTTTYQPLLSLIREGLFPLAMLIGSQPVDAAAFWLPIIQHLVQGTILLAAGATWFRPEAVAPHRVINLGILLALITSEPGGYTMMYFTLFVMLEPWKGVGLRWAIIGCYLLALPLDIIIDKTPPMLRETYFGDRSTVINYYVTLGPFIRPLIVMSIGAALALVTIADVNRDIRVLGWHGRLRLRRRGDFQQSRPVLADPQG
jgi:hypothetical protein